MPNKSTERKDCEDMEAKARQVIDLAGELSSDVNDQITLIAYSMIALMKMNNVEFDDMVANLFKMWSNVEAGYNSNVN